MTNETTNETPVETNVETNVETPDMGVDTTIDKSTILSIYVKKIDKIYTIRLNELPEDVVLTAIQHGLKQKLGDSLASSKNKNWTHAQQIKIVNDLWSSIKKGEWTVKTSISLGAKLILKYRKLYFKKHGLADDHHMTDAEYEKVMASAEKELLLLEKIKELSK